MAASSLTGCAELKERITGSKSSADKVKESDNRITEKQTTQVGKTFDYMGMTGQGDKKMVNWKCTIQKVKLYNKPSDAGIDTSKLVAMADYYKTPDTDKSIDQNLSANSTMLLCDVEIKNVNDDFPSITEISLVAKDSKGDAQLVGFPNYFSKPEDSTTKYYNFTLPKGSKETFQVGWYINLDDYKKENLYLATAYDSAMKDGSSLATYVKLDL